MTWQQDRDRERYEARQAKAKEGFQRWVGFLHLNGYGYEVPAFKRVYDACGAVLEYRRAFNQHEGYASEQHIVAVRVAADTFAGEIEASATAEHDAATIRWVVAGLRCSAKPFCEGCPACFTVTAPLRHEVKARATSRKS